MKTSSATSSCSALRLALGLCSLSALGGGSTAAPLGAVVHPQPMASSGHAQHHVAGFLWLRLLHSRPLWDGGVFLVAVTLQLPLLLVIMISGGDFLDQLLMFCVGTHAHKVE